MRFNVYQNLQKPYMIGVRSPLVLSHSDLMVGLLMKDLYTSQYDVMVKLIKEHWDFEKITEPIINHVCAFASLSYPGKRITKRHILNWLYNSFVVDPGPQDYERFLYSIEISKDEIIKHIFCLTIGIKTMDSADIILLAGLIHENEI